MDLWKYRVKLNGKALLSLLEKYWRQEKILWYDCAGGTKADQCHLPETAVTQSQAEAGTISW